jgi:hypothetical protein
MNMYRRFESQLLDALGAQKRVGLTETLLGVGLPLAAGVVVGAVLGMAYAPKAGPLLRRDVRDWFRDRRDNATAPLPDNKHNVEDGVNGSSAAGANVVTRDGNHSR